MNAANLEGLKQRREGGLGSKKHAQADDHSLFCHHGSTFKCSTLARVGDLFNFHQIYSSCSPGKTVLP